MIRLTHESRILLAIAPADFRAYAPTIFMRRIRSDFTLYD